MTRILIGNDDGIKAPGLQALAKGLAKSSNYDVRVGAPDSERSGSSHAVSGRIGITSYPDGAQIGLPSNVRAFSTSGFPSDAVRLPFVYGKDSLQFVSTWRCVDIYGDQWKPDLVVSGINRGGNAGKNLVISGTVGAASEASIRKTKALAVSLYLHKHGGRTEEDYALAVPLICPVVDWFDQETDWPTSVLLNVNIPFNGTASFDASTSISEGKLVLCAAERHYKFLELLPKGLVVVPQGRSFLDSTAEVVEASNGDDTDKHEMHIRFRWTPDLDIQGTILSDDVLAMHMQYMTLTPFPVYHCEGDLKKAQDLLQTWQSKHKHPLVNWFSSAGHCV